SRREIELTRFDDSHRGKNGPLRNPPEQLRPQNRARFAWTRRRRCLLRRKEKHSPAKSQSGDRFCQWRRNASAAFAFGLKTVPQRSRKLQRLSWQKSHAQLRRHLARGFRRAAQRLQRLRRQPYPSRFLRTRSAKSRLLRRRRSRRTF